MKKLLIIHLFCFSSLFSFGQENKNLNYDDLIKIVTSNDTITLSKVLNKNTLEHSCEANEFQLPLIYYACSNGKIDMVKFLLSRGANPNVISRYGTPANFAMEAGHMAIFSLLLDYGFDARIQEMSYWVEKNNSDDINVPKWMKKIITQLKSEGSDYSNYPYMEYSDPADPLLLNASIQYAPKENYDIAKRIINQGVNVNLLDKKGMSALHLSVVGLDTLGVSFLIKNKANVNLPMYSSLYKDSPDVVYDDNLTPLHLLLYFIKEKPEIIENKKAEILCIIKMLMNAGADVNVKTKHKKQSVLKVAQEINNIEIIKSLNIVTSQQNKL
jgi:ankyrin repeat protein